MRERYLDYPGAANESDCMPCPAGTYGMYMGADAVTQGPDAESRVYSTVPRLST